jgi:hypothetical protein
VSFPAYFKDKCGAHDLPVWMFYENWYQDALEISIKLRGTSAACFVIRR